VGTLAPADALFRWIERSHFRQRNDTPMRRFLRHSTLQEYVFFFVTTIKVNWSGMSLCVPTSSAAPASVRFANNATDGHVAEPDHCHVENAAAVSFSCFG
jgi:hypothetical protein